MVKKYVMDESKSWEERYKELEAHHIAETTELFSKLSEARRMLEESQVEMKSTLTQLKEHQEKLLKLLDEAAQARIDASARKGYPWD